MATNPINTGNSGLRVEISQSRTRQAPRTDFGSMVSTGLSRTTNAVMDAGQLAAPFIPGGAVLSAAISGVGQLKQSASGMSQGGGVSVSPNGVGMSSSPVGSSSNGMSTLSSSGTGNPSSATTDAQALMELSQSFNMQYLMLQQQMQADNRQFTTLSNIMKTKHDTAKNAINNVR